jgi:hypothetical protein
LFFQDEQLDDDCVVGAYEMNDNDVIYGIRTEDDEDSLKRKRENSKGDKSAISNTSSAVANSSSSVNGTVAITLFLNLPNGEVVTIKASQQTRFLKIKGIAANAIGVYLDKVRLYYNDNWVPDDGVVRNYVMKDNDVIFCRTEMTGC